MESRANFALVGLFTLAVLAAAFGFIYWFNSGGGRAKQQVGVVFKFSVTGLGRGSSVLFNGLRVGEVSTIDLDPVDPRQINAVIAVEGSTPIKTDTDARIEGTGLTGVVSLQLIGGSKEAAVLQPKQGQTLPTIEAKPSEFQDLLQTIRQIANRTNGIFDGLESLVTTNARPITETIENARRFSQALGDNAEGIGNLMRAGGQVAESIGPLAQRLGTLSEDLSGVVRAIDQRKITNTLDNVERFTASLSDPAGDIARTARETASLTGKLNAAIDQQKLTATLGDLQTFASVLGNSGGEVARATRDIASLAERFNKAIDDRKIASTLDNIEKFSAALGGSSGEVKRTADNVASITEKLNRAADQIEGVLKGAEAFLNSAAGEEGKGTFAEITKAAQSIRVLADNLDKRTAEITAGINRFTGPGLRDLETLAADGKRTLTDVGRTLRNLERNPQQFIFGGRPPLPQYGGSR